MVGGCVCAGWQCDGDRVAWRRRRRLLSGVGWAAVMATTMVAVVKVGWGGWWQNVNTNWRRWWQRCWQRERGW